MSAKPSTAAPLEASVATTFDMLSWEIELAGARCIFLDALIGELMPNVPPERRERLMQGMQAVDLLAQHLTSLSAFARQMAANAPEDAALPVDIGLADITLGDLAGRMRTALGGEEVEETGDARADAGALDLF